MFQKYFVLHSVKIFLLHFFFLVKHFYECTKKRLLFVLRRGIFFITRFEVTEETKHIRTL
jgi:hypothetical protein